jgi:hypothetical protein
VNKHLRQRLNAMPKTAVVLATGFFVLQGLQPAARADALAYMSTGTDQFGIIDLNTGVFTESGNSGQLLSGLGVSGGRLYGGVEDTGDLYQANPANGVLTLVGAGTINYLSTGSTTGGLYALGGPNTAGAALSLYSINPATGAAALIGPTGLDLSTTVVDTVGISTGSGTLYLTFGPSFSSSTLYSVNVTTGAATSIGNTGADGVGATLFENGTLYAGSNTNGVSLADSLYTLNPSTGAGTFVANESGGATQFDGLAPVTAATVPEPRCLAFLLTVCMAIGAATRGLRTIEIT